MRTMLTLCLLVVPASPAPAAPLQVCATVPELGVLTREVGGDEVSVVVFAKGTEDPHFVEARPSFVKELSRADLLTDHPYNTYLRTGLPPGPIASPGLGAIEAALDPAPVKYLFFVAQDDRRHHFSISIDDHNRAVARYRRLSRR